VITAVDTSVLIAIDQGEPDSETWVDLLAGCREEGALVICDIVAAEFFAVVLDENHFQASLHDLGVERMPASAEAVLKAGRIFRSYRDAGGPRDHLIPDFLIGAHALQDCDRLAAVDRGFLRTYFQDLVVLTADG